MRVSTRTLWLVGLTWACAPTGDEVTDDTDTVTDDTDTEDTDTEDTDTETEDTDDTDVDETDETDVDTTTWPASPDDYIFEEATYLSSFDIPPATGPNACCRDWGAISKNGVGKTDNALGALAASVKAFVDLEDQLDSTVESGSFVALLDHRDLPAGNGTYPMGFFLGSYEGSTDYDLAAAGDGTFTCEPDSFVAGSGRPQVVYPRASLTDGHLVAADGDFSIALALVGISLVVPVSDVTLEADLTSDADGVSLTNGELSGYVKVDDFFAAYNDVVAAACGCAGLPGDLFTYNTTNKEWENDCRTNASVAASCTDPDEEICITLIGNGVLSDPIGVCSLLGPLFPGLADIDLNGTKTEYEGLSIGLTFEGVPADVVGLTP